MISHHLLSPQVWNRKELLCTYCKDKWEKTKGRGLFSLADEKDIQDLVLDKHYLRSSVCKMSITAKPHSIHCTGWFMQLNTLGYTVLILHMSTLYSYFVWFVLNTSINICLFLAPFDTLHLTAHNTRNPSYGTFFRFFNVCRSNLNYQNVERLQGRSQ